MLKRGVSPLIATVLLVMIVVSIGASVMVLIQGITQESIDSATNQKNIIKCSSDVNLVTVESKNKYRICINRANLTNNKNMTIAITLGNEGLMDVADFKIEVFGDTIETIETSKGVERGKYVTLKYFFPNITGNIDKIKLYPKIPGGPTSQIITCNEPNLEWSYDQIRYFTDCNEETWDDAVESYT